MPAGLTRWRRPGPPWSSWRWRQDPWRRWPRPAHRGGGDGDDLADLLEGLHGLLGRRGRSLHLLGGGVGLVQGEAHRLGHHVRRGVQKRPLLVLEGLTIALAERV